MSVWRPFLRFKVPQTAIIACSGGATPDPASYFNRQRAVPPDWMGRIVLLGQNTVFISDEYEREASLYKIIT
jgi:hypothetical protein